MYTCPCTSTTFYRKRLVKVLSVACSFALTFYLNASTEVPITFFLSFPDLMDDVPAATRINIWFQHDGAPAHFSYAVPEFLDRTYPNRWIGRGGPVEWPPWSPDLTPLDFYLWGHMKSMVNETPLTLDMDLIARTAEVIARVRDFPGQFERVRESMRWRCETSIVANERNFEHLLQCNDVLL